MSEDPRYRIRVEVSPRYLPSESQPEHHIFAFSYHIRIYNEGELSVQLLSRRWLITNGNDEVREVEGPGVVGKQPHIAPGGCHEYSSGAALDTEIGSMWGSYQMLAEDGHEFEADIPIFTLAARHALH